jgi:hypothetical protein
MISQPMQTTHLPLPWREVLKTPKRDDIRDTETKTQEETAAAAARQTCFAAPVADVVIVDVIAIAVSLTNVMRP